MMFNKRVRSNQCISTSGVCRSPSYLRLERLEDRSQPSVLAGLTDFPTGTMPAGIVARDFNGDNVPDLATANFLSDSVSILLANGDGSFREGTTITGLKFPTSVVAADFNKDGKLDLAVGNAQSNTVSIQLGNGNGTFTPASAEVVVAANTTSLAVGDFNRDGKPDLAVGNAAQGNSPGIVSIRLGRGNGTFRAAANVRIGSEPASIVAGHFNGDRNLDLVIAGNGGNVLAVRLGRGDGSFRGAAGVIVDTSPISVAAGDFNGDGKLDLAAVSSLTDTVSIRLNKGNATFRFAPTRVVGPAAQFVVVADFNSDNRPDLAVVNSGDQISTFTGSVRIILGQGQGEFSESTTVTTSAQSEAAAVGDFDGDGKLDFAATNSNSNNVSVARGLGDGKFVAAIAINSTPFPMGQEPAAVLTGDFDKDGNLDLLVANAGTSTVEVLLGDGNGTFSFPIPPFVYVGSLPVAMVSGDFNNDGDLDFLTANRAANTVSVRLGDGDGRFTSPTLAEVGVGEMPAGIAVGDFDGDDNLDFVTTNLDSGNISVRLGNGDGSFRDGPQPEIPVSGGPSAVAVGDFDGDDILDLAVTDLFDRSVTLLLGNGAGNFTPTGVPKQVGLAPRSVAVGDFNGDGHLDLVTANNGSNTASVLLGNGDGTFGPAIDYEVGMLPVAVTVADLDGDGNLDLIVAANGYSDVSVLLGNSNGTFQDTVNYLAGTNPTGVVAGDFNGDGNLDVAVSLDASDGVNILFGEGTP